MFAYLRILTLNILGLLQPDWFHLSFNLLFIFLFSTVSLIIPLLSLCCMVHFIGGCNISKFFCTVKIDQRRAGRFLKEHFRLTLFHKFSWGWLHFESRTDWAFVSWKVLQLESAIGVWVGMRFLVLVHYFLSQHIPTQVEIRMVLSLFCINSNKTIYWVVLCYTHFFLLYLKLNFHRPPLNCFFYFLFSCYYWLGPMDLERFLFRNRKLLWLFSRKRVNLKTKNTGMKIFGIEICWFRLFRAAFRRRRRNGWSSFSDFHRCILTSLCFLLFTVSTSTKRSLAF
jgi:hypothetical protein